MTYEETLNFLFGRLQSFHNDGAVAYKPGLQKAFLLSEAFGNPHDKFRSIHVGGTNGKGSTAHSLASVLMAAGLKVGLYTSPHLIDFSERIRINGIPIDKQSVINFTERFIAKNLTGVDPSFFELATIMAFDYFARNGVDIAVIEVGLGGRLDTTNIIKPELSVITNVALDHTNLLGATLGAIAAEKAGIIKEGIPVVIGRRNPETDSVFTDKGEKTMFAQDIPLYASAELRDDLIVYSDTPWGDIASDLTGACQPENMQTILTALVELEKKGIVPLDKSIVQSGLANVCKNTGLMGRWMYIRRDPDTIVDTAHNPDGWTGIIDRLKDYNPEDLYFVLGFAADKNFETILSLLPTKAGYYFVKPDVRRAAAPLDIQTKALKFGIQSKVFESVKEGYFQALSDADTAMLLDRRRPLVYVGGSNFVVGDLLRESSADT